MADTGKDARGPGWFWADNSIIDTYAARIGVHAVAVYMVLVRHLNSNDESWPSTAAIATKLGISPRTVVKSIQTLKDHGLIEVTQRDEQGKGHISNLYTIHRAAPPVEPETPPLMHVVHKPMQEMQKPYAGDAPPLMHDVHKNKTNVNKTQGTRNDGDGGAARLIGLGLYRSQAAAAVAAFASRDGLTDADLDLCERWLAANPFDKNVATLANMLKRGELPVIRPPRASRPDQGGRRGPPPAEAPGVTVEEARRLGAARKAEALKGLPSWA